SAFEGDAPIVPAPARGSEGPRLHGIRRTASPDKDVPSSRRSGPKALRTRRICDSYRCGMIDREAIVEVLERYNPSGIQVATIGSHSALDVCDGAVRKDSGRSSYANEDGRRRTRDTSAHRETRTVGRSAAPWTRRSCSGNSRT